MEPLKGIKVLDLTINSSYCGMELADYGAEVIKVEEPSGGDPLRGLAPLKDGASPHHIYRDRGKMSITLDLQKPEGQDILRKLVKESDAIIENFVPGTLEKLGLGYEDLSKINPTIVYGRISAYGSTGKGAETPQSDLVAQAKCGVMHLTGFPENPPTRIGFNISEHYAASFLASAICIAIYRAKKYGEGQMVEATLAGSAIAISEDKVITYGADNEDPMRTGNAHPLINPYDILKCKDGYVAMGISSDAQWTKFCKAFNTPEWDEDEKYCSNLVRGYHYFGDLRIKIEELFSNYTMQEITDICDEHLIPGTMCSTTKEALNEQQLKERNMIVDLKTEELGTIRMPGRPIKFSGESESAIKDAPALGEQTEKILTDLGYDSEKIDQLKDNGII